MMKKIIKDFLIENTEMSVAVVVLTAHFVAILTTVLSSYSTRTHTCTNMRVPSFN